MDNGLSYGLTLLADQRSAKLASRIEGDLSGRWFYPSTTALMRPCLMAFRNAR